MSIIMKKLSLKEIRKIQLEIMDSFSAFCDLHGLRYFLDAGTLLGAIRHKGFIPWDDDVDICMPRPDYERFLKLTSRKLNENIIVSTEFDGIYAMPKLIDKRTTLIEFPKTIKNRIGVYVDLFPKDGIPELSLWNRILCKRVAFNAKKNWFNKVSIYKWKNHGSLLRKAIASVGRRVIKDKDRPLRRLLRLATKYNYDSSAYVATIVAGGMANCVKKECFDSYLLWDFEDRKNRVPVGYDE